MGKNILLVGISGHMGRLIYSRLLHEPAFNCVGGYDRKQPDFEVNVPVTTQIVKIIDLCDLVVDFSLPDATMPVLKACIDNKKGMIIGTTGYSNAQLSGLREASKSIPLVLSYNMSLGVHIARKLVRKMAGFFPENYDVEIIEKHSKTKQDAPSGTAYMFGEDVASSRKQNLSRKAVFGRKGVSPRKKGDITFHSLRAGSLVAEHEIYFVSDHDQIVISHSAFDYLIFVDGVIQALKFIQNKKPGWYTMEDVLG